MNSENNKDSWDTIITSKRRFWQVDFRAIVKFRFLIYLFFRRDFVANFKQTVLGPVWFIVQPLLTTIVFVFIFGKSVPGGIPAPIYYLSAIVIWSFFADVFNKTANTFIQNASIFGKVYFPRLVVPVSLVLSGLLKFMVQFIMLIGLCVYYQVNGQIEVDWSFIALTPILLILVGLMAMSGGILASSLTAKYRDFKHLFGFGIQLIMYITVLYPFSVVSMSAQEARANMGLKISETGYSWAECIVAANPMNSIVEGFRIGYSGASPNYFSPYFILYTVGFTLLLFLISIGVFNKTEQNFMDTV